MSEILAGNIAMQDQPGAGGPPPYGMQPGYPTAQPGYPQPMMAQPMMAQPMMAQQMMTQPMRAQQTNATVVVTQPIPVAQQQRMRDWSSGLCGCCEDCYSCKSNVHRLTGELTRSKVRRLPFTLY